MSESDWDWFCAGSGSSLWWFRLTAIVAVRRISESRRREEGWLAWVVGAVYVRGVKEPIALNAEQWDQLCTLVGFAPAVPPPAA